MSARACTNKLFAFGVATAWQVTGGQPYAASTTRCSLQLRRCHWYFFICSPTGGPGRDAKLSAAPVSFKCRSDAQIAKLDEQLAKYKEQIKKTRPGPAQDAIKRRALQVHRGRGAGRWTSSRSWTEAQSAVKYTAVLAVGWRWSQGLKAAAGSYSQREQHDDCAVLG